MDLLKNCGACGQDKPLTHFSKKHNRLQPKCKSCQSLYYKRYREKNRLKLVTASSDYYKENQEDLLSKKADYRVKNREDLKLKSRLYYKDNKLVFKDYRTARKTRVKQATPPWLTKLHWQEIESIYSLARDCQITSGQMYHVDHILPLKGKNVCGLHVPWNLQVLPADINQSKRNKEIPDYDRPY
jgi:hypothetical protein